MGARVIKPPAPVAFEERVASLFLAGSIEMGQAENWQARAARGLEDLDVVIFNPRRDDWDASWEQSIANPNFRSQVEWELEAQERATVILMYFAPSTRSPITLLELGLFAGSGKLLVCCPEGFWRKGNVDVVCTRYAVPMVPDLTSLVERARDQLLSSRAQ